MLRCFEIFSFSSLQWFLITNVFAERKIDGRKPKSGDRVLARVAEMGKNGKPEKPMRGGSGGKKGKPIMHDGTSQKDDGR